MTIILIVLAFFFFAPVEASDPFALPAGFLRNDEVRLQDAVFCGWRPVVHHPQPRAIESGGAPLQLVRTPAPCYDSDEDSGRTLETQSLDSVEDRVRILEAKPLTKPLTRKDSLELLLSDMRRRTDFYVEFSLFPAAFMLKRAPLIRGIPGAKECACLAKGLKQTR